MVLFSVIVANYNNGCYLPYLIQSIYNQTYNNWELIIVDDASTVDTDPYIKGFLTDRRIIYVKHECNMGAGAAFKSAADLASGEIIGMLGADDALVPNAIEIMVKAHLQFPEASMINSECYNCDENLNIICKYDYYKPLNPGESLIRNMTVGSFATFKRTAYLKTKGFSVNFKRAVDHDIYLKLDEVGTLQFVYEPLYLYRRNKNGISQNENGTKALQYSIIARFNAYKRRLGTNKDNLSKNELKTLFFIYYKQEFHNAFSEKAYKKLIPNFFKCCLNLNSQTLKPFIGIFRYSFSKLFKYLLNSNLS